MNPRTPDRTPRHGRHAARRLAVLAACLALTMPAGAGPVLQRVTGSGTVRVCIWPDYHGISMRNPRTGQLQGIDIDLSAAFGRFLGARVEYVDSSFARLVPNLVEDRCDIAMHAVGITAEREQYLRFSQPYLRSDIYGVVARGNRVVRKWEDIDRPGVRVAVQAGTFMQPVMAGKLTRAQLVVVQPPQTREEELQAGRVDVFMTDYPYSRRLMDNADWARLIESPEPFSVLPYGYAVKRGDAAWLATVEAFVARIKADGRLQRAASQNGLSAIVVR